MTNKTKTKEQAQMSKKNKLRIAHIHVWDKKNKGDLAIVLAVQELIKKEFNNCL